MNLDLFAGIKAIVFDAYGTLVDITDRRRPYAKLLQALTATGRIPCESDAARLMSAPVGLAGTAHMFGVELPASILAPIEQDLFAELASVMLYPDTIRTMASLRQVGIKIGVCSNLAAPYAIPVKTLLPLPLDAYAWSFEVGAIKPDSAMYRLVCEMLACAPQEILFVGDRLDADYHGPRGVGMRSVHLVRHGDAQVTETIQSLDELTAPFMPAHV